MSNELITFEAALGGAELTRAYAIRFAGLAAVKAADAVNCDFTMRVRADGLIEFSGSAGFMHADAVKHTLTAYYYQDKFDVADCDDLSNLTWDVDHYRIS